MIKGSRETLKLARKLRSEMSLPEALLWRALRARPGGLKFRRQHPAGAYIIDFYCAKPRLAIEVDGWSHDNPNRVRREAVRSHFLRSQGVATMRIPATVVLEDVEPVVRRIRQVCERRMERLMVPLHQPAAGPPPRAGEES